MNKETKLRGIAAMIFTVLSIALTIVFFVTFTKNGDSISDSLISSPMLGFTLGGMTIGFTHVSSIRRKIEGLLSIPLVGWAIGLLLIIGIPYFGGWIFMLADLFKYLKARKEAQ